MSLRIEALDNPLKNGEHRLMDFIVNINLQLISKLSSCRRPNDSKRCLEYLSKFIDSSPEAI